LGSAIGFDSALGAALGSVITIGLDSALGAVFGSTVGFGAALGAAFGAVFGSDIAIGFDSALGAAFGSALGATFGSAFAGVLASVFAAGASVCAAGVRGFATVTVLGWPPLALAYEVLSTLAAVMCCAWTLVGGVCFSLATARSAGVGGC
jgi:hypothetical protein